MIFLSTIRQPVNGRLMYIKGPLELRARLSAARLPRSTNGVALADREPIIIWIPADFPLRPPAAASAHTKFAGQPHVQWGSQLCLYGFVQVRSDRTGGLTSFVGFWHTHPNGLACPSQVDRKTMQRLLDEMPGHSRRLLSLVLAVPGSGPPAMDQEPVAWTPDIYAEVLTA